MQPLLDGVKKQNRNFIMTVAWVFPGQGSQKIGMAKQIETLPNTKQRFSYASEIFEKNLFDICELDPDKTTWEELLSLAITISSSFFTNKSS